MPLWYCFRPKTEQEKNFFPLFSPKVNICSLFVLYYLYLFVLLQSSIANRCRQRKLWLGALKTEYYYAISEDYSQEILGAD